MNPFQIAEVSSATFFVNDFFKRAFGENTPEWGRHLVFFYRKAADTYVPLGYMNYLPHDEVLLVGGGVTNGRGFVHVSDEHSEQIRRDGGIFYQLLVFGFQYFAEDCEAYFGHVGEPRAYEIDLKAGFVQTQYDQLVAHFHKPISDERKAYLTEKIHALGEF